MRASRTKSKSDKSKPVFDLLRQYESRNVTYFDPDGSWPIVWERAQGVWVWDRDGRKYLDLTGAFGVAAAGHGNRQVVRAGQRQMGRLLHAMGDVHPHARKAELARELSRLTFERWPPARNQPALKGKTLFCNSGFEAVEAALKTARLATGRPGVITFEGAYHGLGYGALNATHREHFRSPFRDQLREFGHPVPFPRDEVSQTEAAIRRLFRQEQIGAVLVEPIQVRGGVNVPPADFLPLLRRLCDEHQALLILDEIYTGFGRTGRWFACEHSATVPDVICLGKALTGGFPLSACVGSAEVMDRAWPLSTGEAIHTSTFLGHPVGCAMALAQIKEIEQRDLVKRSAELGAFLLELLAPFVGGSRQFEIDVRGLGLMVGVELRDQKGKPATEAALAAIKAMLHGGFVLLPEGEFSNVISLTPPLVITKAQLRSAVDRLRKVLTL